MCCQIKIRQGIFLCQILVYDNRKKIVGVFTWKAGQILIGKSF